MMRHSLIQTIKYTPFKIYRNIFYIIGVRIFTAVVTACIEMNDIRVVASIFEQITMTQYHLDIN